MSEREASLALGISFLLAVLLTLSGLGVVHRWVDRPLDRAEAGGSLWEDRSHVDDPLEQALGQDDSDRPTTISWIPHESYQELLARQAETDQPGTHREADPAEDAPVELDPTPPAPQPAEAQPPAEPAPLQEQVALAHPPGLDYPELPDAAGDEERLPPPGEMDEPSPEPADQPAETAPQPASADAPESTPTVLEQADAEAVPTRLDEDDLEFRPGNVIVGEGIEIETAHPRLSVASRMTAMPRDTAVRIVFEGEGSPIHAEMLESTGYRDWDAAIVASLYRWRARGQKVEQAETELIIELPYRFLR